ncbi:MAG: Maltose/maltodextrin transport ATP-binding protein MalK [uncultured Rubrobacteraceae bacterium]|uniref:Maltose/maltodextrin transport ATP-binding protein MalK n=1 Tax=uncultured Rubrobacteraceae bacterium TaxID=349277 RepID=A0A6J4SVD2_9ACTN|nr:MAG: Maltose/maltodextrin transport ATP-binding protein MalK [uncultured Rubrobacteraceae bacterium]
MAEVTMEEVTKIYGGDVTAVDKMNLDIPDGEFVVFVGPSGCGKSTALRMIAGLEDISGGKVFIGDRVVNDLPPRERDIAMVFQNYALYPHMNVRENMGFALKLRKMEKSQINQRVDEAARILSIEHFLDRKPKALSGGQRQRVALGRAIVREPKAFLMDEPLSNLDAKLRVQMRTEIAKLHNRIGTTTIYVTHDQTEAMTMADRIVVLKDGLVQQVDSPQQMYDHPNNVFVAGFIGSPAMNFLRARLERENGGYTVTFGSTRIPLSSEVVGEVKERRGKDLGEHVGEIVLGIRPEHLEDAETEAAEVLGGTEGSSCVDVETQVIESMGSEKYIYFEPPREQAVRLSSIASMTDDDEGGAQEDTMGGSAEDVGGNLMVARVAPESTAREGQKIRLVVDTTKIRIFDPETEQAIL